MNLYRGVGSAASDGYVVDISPESAGWGFSGLRVLDLAPDGVRQFGTGADEVVVLPLAGSCTVEGDGSAATLAGRPSVFAGPSDFAYVPRESEVRIRSERGGRFAILSARARQRLAFQYVAAAEVPVILRGAGSMSRQVNNFGDPEVLHADRMIACEVVTPAGNWSSYPPHKHDVDRPGETALEEIYYYEVAREGMAYQRVYGSDQRPVDVLAEVRTGDVVLVPYGWHGPTMAVPGYDLYYLNVMAGPGERSWLICDDPAHTWVRDTWVGQPIDPRLPVGGAR